jgi:hypothetical protein
MNSVCSVHVAIAHRPNYPVRLTMHLPLPLPSCRYTPYIAHLVYLQKVKNSAFVFHIKVSISGGRRSRSGTIRPCRFGRSRGRNRTRERPTTTKTTMVSCVHPVNPLGSLARVLDKVCIHFSSFFRSAHTASIDPVLCILSIQHERPTALASCHMLCQILEMRFSVDGWDGRAGYFVESEWREKLSSPIPFYTSSTFNKHSSARPKGDLFSFMS